MTPDRIAELRAAGVLDGSKAGEARIALLNIYETARGYMRERAPTRAAIEDEIRYGFDRIMADTPKGRALRWARKQARRRALKDGRS